MLVSAPGKSDRPHRRPHLLHILSLALLVPLACGEMTTYDPAKDTEALSTITGVWVGEVDDQVVTLTLCENKVVAQIRDGKSPSGCSIDHIVTSQPYTPVVRNKGGCGGCNLLVVAPVIATLEHPGLEGTIKIKGEVSLGTAYDDDPYALPYSLRLSSGNGANWKSLPGGMLVPNLLELYIADIKGFGASFPRVLSRDQSLTPSCP